MSIKVSCFPALNVFGMTLLSVVAGGFIDPVLHPAPVYIPTSDGTWTIRGTPANAAGDNDAASHPALVLNLEPPLVIMLNNQQELRNLELHITVRVRSEDALAMVRLHEPAITSRLLDLMYGQDVRSLQGGEGIEALRRECLEAAQRVLIRETGAPVIEDLYFADIFFQ
jgi:flagellar basal body-associated protein FliL